MYVVKAAGPLVIISYNKDKPNKNYLITFIIIYLLFIFIFLKNIW